MNSQPEGRIRENGDFNSSNSSLYGDVVDTTLNINIEAEDKKRADLVEWLNGILPDLRLPLESSEQDIRVCLIDGAVLCCITNRLSPRPVNEGSSYGLSSEVYMDNVKRFLAAMDELGLPKFELSDLEQGSMTKVLECLWTLKQQFGSSLGGDNNLVSISKPGSQQRKKWRVSENEHLEGNTGSQGDATSSGQHTTLSVEERQKNLSDYQSKKNSSDSKFQHVLHSPVMSESSAALIHHVGHKFHEVFQLKQGCYADLPPAKISEMLKSTSLDNAPTQSLLSVVNGILDESIERKNGEIPHRVACLLRKVVQEIERRISTQAEHLRTQNNLYKAREEKYKSRIRVLETLAAGTNEKTKIVNELQQTKTEKTKMEERMKHEQDVLRLMKEKDLTDSEISSLKQELVMAKRTYEERCLQLESEAKGTKHDLEERLKELEFLLKTSQEEVKEFEAFSSSKAENWKKKECSYLSFIKSQFESLQELRVASESIKQEVMSTQQTYLEEFSHLGKKLKGLADTVENYHVVLAENRRLYNEVQDLKGNIRVYCRIRPFLPGQNGKQTTIEYIGDNGELAVVNPSKQGKDSCRMFKFNKVFGPTATQGKTRNPNRTGQNTLLLVFLGSWS
ncbi:PREDICTED: kinesin-like protein KIN-14G isoform X2 [Nelumbo nucifera]|uniref:Kinesin-like protein KIN-14G isoform X2 n=1 Tax=Nelumbo nucifera TaxID=4432 RepID=A0A1U7YXD5_NELNU|nr:PREDICTED: kinesin-like protein KIN-14G isoform X2 [Nelumbo nucifera]